MRIPILNYIEKKIREKKRSMKVYSTAYETNIYFPYYDRRVKFSSQKPDIYNLEGQKMDTWFIRDVHFCHNPYMLNSKYFLWDRFNIGLNTHFYSHAAMLETMGTPTYRYGILVESKTIEPIGYELFKNHKGLEKDFDAIFTYDAELLNSLDNAKFLPYCAHTWYGNVKDGGTFDSLAYKKKKKMISMISSDKCLCDLHLSRLNLAKEVKAKNMVDTFGTFDGGGYTKLADTLTDYRFSIIIENDITDYFFTEKITSCFAAHTIPIYLGARKINNFFNQDGIIKITTDDLENIDAVLKQCTESEYEARTSAIIDNYNRSKKYFNIDDWLYENYFMNIK